MAKAVDDSVRRLRFSQDESLVKIVPDLCLSQNPVRTERPNKMKTLDDKLQF
ncbi:hypothetical protein Hdeb2414_s0023g00636911 [Helianthus debilis subsp. tardiflorus]